MCQAQDGLQHADQGAPRGTLLRVGPSGDLHLGDLQVPVAELVPDKLVDGVGDIVEPVFLEAPCHLGLGLLQRRGDPAVGLAEHQIAMRRPARLALCFRVLAQPAVVAFAVHQHEARRVPQFVAKVAIALAALGVEIDIAPERRERSKSEAQRVGAEGRYALGKFLLRVLAHRRSRLGLAQPLGSLGQQGFECDAVDQVDRVEHVALALAHFLPVRVAHQSVYIHVAEWHPAGEVGCHHDHSGHPEEDDVVARYQNA